MSMMAPPSKPGASRKLNSLSKPKPKPKVPIMPRVLTKAGDKPAKPLVPVMKPMMKPKQLKAKPPVPIPAFKRPPVPKGGLAPPKASSAARVEEKEAEVVDEYNPARPNDYEEYCVEREKRKQKEREARRAADRAAEEKPKAPAFKAPPPAGAFKPPSEKKKLDLNISADEMFARRQRMSVKTAPLGLAPPAPKAKGSDNGRGMPPPPGPPPKRSKSNANGVFKTSPGRVILLKNMVGRGEVDAALEGEIVEECSKYGGVIRCKVFEMGAKVAETEAVRIFVQFSTITAATKALKVMHGRFFGGRIVSAVYYPEQKFNKGELEE